MEKVNINFFGHLHQPLNMQGALELEAIIQNIVATPEQEHVVCIEEVGLTPQEAQSATQRYRYDGFRYIYIARRLPLLLRRKPTEMEVRTGIDRLDKALDDKNIDSLLKDLIMTRAKGEVYLYAWMRSLDTLRTNNRIRFELESHPDQVNKLEEQTHAEYMQLGSLIRRKWDNQDYEGFLDTAEQGSVLIYKASDVRDRDIAQQFNPRIQKMVHDGQRKTISFLYGPSHQFDKYLQEGLPASTLEQVSFGAERGIYEDTSEWMLKKMLIQGEQPPRLSFGKFVLERYAMDSICNFFVNRGRASEIAYHYEDYNLSVSNLVTGLSDQDIKEVCEGKAVLQVADMASDQPIYLAL